MRLDFLFFRLWLAAGTAFCGQPDVQLDQALPQIAKEAATFWHTAPRYTARETLKQKAIVPPHRRLRIGQSALEPRLPTFRDREIVSYYGFSSYSASPEAVHEFRRIIAVDGKPVGDPETARSKLRTILETGADADKRSLTHEFQKAGLGNTAIDFGQLILLFTRANLRKYTFELNSVGLVGAARAGIIAFRQVVGQDSLNITEAGVKVRRPLRGELVIGEDDYRPLRITLTAEHTGDKVEIQDHATVEYAPSPGGVILPVSVVYRRYLNDQLYVENVYQYTDWQQAGVN